MKTKLKISSNAKMYLYFNVRTNHADIEKGGGADKMKLYSKNKNDHGFYYILRI